MQTPSGQIVKVGCLTFFLSVSITALFRISQADMVFWMTLLALIFVILLGIIFDLIGTAATAAKEEPFHAMASDRLAGSKKAIDLVRHADQVANFCNDLVGDICGTISGAISAILVIDLVASYNLHRMENIVSVITIGLVAALTVSGKALGKTVAIKEAELILLQVARALEKGERIFRRRSKVKNSNEERLVGQGDNKKGKRKQKA